MEDVNINHNLKRQIKKLLPKKMDGIIRAIDKHKFSNEELIYIRDRLKEKKYRPTYTPVQYFNQERKTIKLLLDLFPLHDNNKVQKM